jgi:acyl-CoA dehydrogenase
MNFDFSEDHRVIQDQIRRFLTDKSPLTRFRDVLEERDRYAEDVWHGLAAMGIQGTAVDEAYGGVGLGYLPLCLAAQSLGEQLSPVPFSSSIYLAAEAISCFGSDAQKTSYLTRLASGELIGTLAVVESFDEPSPQGLACAHQASQVSGTKLLVPHGQFADIAIVLAAGTSGPDMAIVDLADVERTPVSVVDPTIAAASLTFDGASAELLGAAGEGWTQLQTVYDRAAVLFAFEQIGGAERALNMAVNYAKDRYAFGRPIGSFQALKHMMADMYVALKLAESNAYYAAWALENNATDLSLAAATARVSATQAFQLCARDNIQVHGGMGFTWEFDCHLYYRRSNYLTLALGGLTVWEDKLINALPSAA